MSPQRHGRGRGARQPVRRTRGGGVDRDADQAPRGHLSGERLVRPLFRDLSERRQPARRAGFHRRTRTRRKVNNLANANLLTNNPNFTNQANGADAAEPFRLDRTQANTADQNHAYTAEQQAYNGGKADLFPKYTGKGTPGGVGAFGTKGLVMGYFDGNTVTAMWQYAQHFAHERQCLHRHLRPLDAGRDGAWSRARPTA